MAATYYNKVSFLFYYFMTTRDTEPTCRAALRVQIKVGGGVMPSDDSSYTEHKSGNTAHLLRFPFHACHLFI